MKMITLTNVIEEECKDPEFKKRFQREMLINEIAKMVIQLRREAQLTQQELAKKAGTTQPVIARLESGMDHRMPTLELLARLAAAANLKLRIVLDSNDQYQ